MHNDFPETTRPIWGFPFTIDDMSMIMYDPKIESMKLISNGIRSMGLYDFICCR